MNSGAPVSAALNLNPPEVLPLPFSLGPKNSNPTFSQIIPKHWRVGDRVKRRCGFREAGEERGSGQAWFASNK
jgi:hypothetical protein